MVRFPSLLLSIEIKHLPYKASEHTKTNPLPNLPAPPQKKEEIGPWPSGLYINWEDKNRQKTLNNLRTIKDKILSKDRVFVLLLDKKSFKELVSGQVLMEF